MNSENEFGKMEFGKMESVIPDSQNGIGKGGSQ